MNFQMTDCTDLAQRDVRDWLLRLSDDEFEDVAGNISRLFDTLREVAQVRDER